MMIIELYTKTNALAETIEIAAGPIPRVGETITLNQTGWNVQGMTELLVHDVTYLLKNGTLTPLVSCHASNGSIHRRVVLEEQGWLNPLD